MARSPRPPIDQAVPIVLYVDAGEPGGVTVYAESLAGAFRRQGYNVTALCSAAAAVEPTREALRQVGVDVRALEHGGRSLIDRLRRIWAFAAVIRNKRGCILIVLLGNSVAGGPVMAAGRLGRASAVIRADLQPPMPPIAWWRNKIALRLKDFLVQRVVVGSRENVDLFARETGRHPKKMAVIHTGIDLPRYVPAQGRNRVRDEHGFSPQTLVVGMIARLSEERKGAAYFLDMAARLAAEFPLAAFLIIGDGPLRAALERQAKDLGLGGRIRFDGWRSDIVEVLASMDVFVMPSLYEGGPTVVLEAMAMGLPVVSTRVGMVPEVIDNGRTGLVVAPGDDAALADAVAMLLADEQRRTHIGAQARRMAEQGFSADVMATRYLQVCGALDARRERNIPV